MLRDLIASKKAKIGVVGMGYVGLPLAIEIAAKGFKVIGIDIDPARVKSINKGISFRTKRPGGKKCLTDMVYGSHPPP